jgi:putative membrane protein
MPPILRLALPLTALACLALPAVAQEPPPGWRYGPMWEGHWGWMFMGPLMMIIFVAAVVVFVVLALRWIGGGAHHGAPPATRTPLDILKERFARGEIDKAEFEERRRLLQD